MEPRKQKFYRMERALQMLWGMHPGVALEGKENGWNKFYRHFIVIVGPGIYICDVIYLIEKSKSKASVYELGDLYTNVFLQTVFLTRLITVHTGKYVQMVWTFWNKVHLSNYMYHDADTMKIYEQTERQCNVMFTTLFTALLIGPLTYLNTPIVTNVITGAFSNTSISLESAIYHKLPFDYHHDLRGWVFVYFFNYFVSNNKSSYIVHFGIMQMNILIHIIGHMKIIIHRLHTIADDLRSGDAGSVTYTADDDDLMFQRIKRIIDHHAEVLTWLVHFQKFYGLTLLINYTYDTLACCVLLVVLTDNWPMSVLRYGVLASVAFAQLIGESFAMEQLSIMILKTTFSYFIWLKAME